MDKWTSTNLTNSMTDKAVVCHWFYSTYAVIKQLKYGNN
jgi:hypothetical protein